MKSFIIVWIVWALLSLVFTIALVYVAAHFIAKVW